MARSRSALGEFLRSRRDRLTPAEAGMRAFPGPRRVPGLRREELAVLAGVSPDYYSRLEQGRQATISLGVLDSLARALRLDPVEQAHLHDLAAPSRASSASGTLAERADPGLLRVMGALDDVPVLLLGRHMEVLASNALLTAVLGRFEPGDSLMRFLFLDPAARERIVNWPVFAAAAVAHLRRECAKAPDDRRLAALVVELRRASDDVARWWADHGVRDYASVQKRIRHPVAGDLEFDIEIVTAPHVSDQRLIVYTVQPDSPIARLLPLLASWDGSEPARPEEHLR